MMVSRATSFGVGLMLSALVAWAAVGGDGPQLHVTKDGALSLPNMCDPGYSASIRPPESVTRQIKLAMCAAQHPTKDCSSYEMDHIVPLCLGGDPLNLNNLQLQLWPAARRKDHFEAEVCRAYCAGRLTLEQARGMFKRDGE